MGICSTELHQDAEGGPPRTLHASVRSSSLGVNPQHLFPLMSERKKNFGFCLLLYFYVSCSAPSPDNLESEEFWAQKKRLLARLQSHFLRVRPRVRLFIGPVDQM